jgi:hypothetical protein
VIIRKLFAFGISEAVVALPKYRKCRRSTRISEFIPKRMLLGIDLRLLFFSLVAHQVSFLGE